MILNKLQNNDKRDSTRKNYHQIWRQFNGFLIQLNKRPDSWEQRVALYCSYLCDQGAQSATLKSYISAIKYILKKDGYDWDESKILFSSITNACRLVNDKVKIRLPIKGKLLELILYEIERGFKQPQPYLVTMYRAIFMLGFYGLMRIGELTNSPHVLRAENVHIGKNKNKILLILYSSKTHGLESRPQQIKIKALDDFQDKLILKGRKFCPFTIVRQYARMRGSIEGDDEQFFVFKDKKPVFPDHVRKILRGALERMNLDESLYDCHSLRIGRSTELYFDLNLSIDRIRQLGRWKSTAVFKYLKGTTQIYLSLL